MVKKQHLSHSIVFAVLLLMIFAGCKKDNDSCKYEGEIFAYDFRECLCCPGWFIKVNNDTLKFQTLPEEDFLWDKVNSEGFPVRIRFEYTQAEGDCSDEYFEATCYQVIN